MEPTGRGTRGHVPPGSDGCSTSAGHDEMGIEQERGRRLEVVAEPIDPKGVMEEVEDDAEDDEEGGRPPDK